MYDNVKICPNCNAEYFPHVEICHECQVKLIRPGEATPKREPLAERPVVSAIEASEDRQFAAIESGDLNKLRELEEMLLKRGVEVFVEKKDITDKSCAKKTVYLLIVPVEWAEESLHAIRAYWQEKYPEMRSAIENEDAGLCPACGEPVSAIASECPSCGLCLSVPETPDKDGGCCPTC